MQEVLKKFQNYLEVSIENIKIQLKMASGYKKIALEDKLNLYVTLSNDLKRNDLNVVTDYFEQLSEVLLESNLTPEERLLIVIHYLSLNIIKGITDQTCIYLVESKINSYPYQYTNAEKVLDLYYSGKYVEYFQTDISALNERELLEYAEIKDAFRVCQAENKMLEIIKSAHLTFKKHFLDKGKQSVVKLDESDITPIIDAMASLGVSDILLTEFEGYFKEDLNRSEVLVKNPEINQILELISKYCFYKSREEVENLILNSSYDVPSTTIGSSTSINTRIHNVNRSLMNLSFVYSFLMYRESARLSKTIIGNLEPLNVILTDKTLKDKDVLKFLFTLIRLNIINGILDTNEVEIIQNPDLYSINLENIISANYPYPCYFSNRYRTTVMSDRPTNNAVKELTGSVTIDSLKDIQDAHRVLSYYADNLNTINSNDINNIIKSFKVLNLGNEVLNRVSNALEAIQTKNSKKTVKNTKKPIEIVPALKVKPLKSKVEQDTEFSQILERINEYFDMDTKTPTKPLNDEEVHELYDLFVLYGLPKNDLDNYMWKVKRLNEMTDAFGKYASYKRLAQKYMTDEIKEVMDLIDSEISSYENVQSKDAYERCEKDIRAMLPDFIILVETSRTNTLAKNVKEFN